MTKPKFEKPDFGAMTRDGMLTSYNEMVMTAIDLGMTKWKERRAFRDREDALRNCDQLHSSIQAWMEGQHAEDNRIEEEGYDPAGHPEPRPHEQPKIGSEKPKAGIEKLRAQPGAEDVRQAVLADQAAALNTGAVHAATAPEDRVTEESSVPVKKSKKSEADGRIITVAPRYEKENPLRGAAKARFAHYRTGQTVAQYAAALAKAGLGDVSRARRDVRWDAAEGRIKVK